MRETFSQTLYKIGHSRERIFNGTPGSRGGYRVIDVGLTQKKDNKKSIRVVASHATGDNDTSPDRSVRFPPSGTSEPKTQTGGTGGTDIPPGGRDVGSGEADQPDESVRRERFRTTVTGLVIPRPYVPDATSTKYKKGDLIIAVGKPEAENAATELHYATISRPLFLTSEGNKVSSVKEIRYTPGSDFTYEEWEEVRNPQGELLSPPTQMQGTNSIDLFLSIFEEAQKELDEEAIGADIVTTDRYQDVMTVLQSLTEKDVVSPQPNDEVGMDEIRAFQSAVTNILHSSETRGHKNIGTYARYQKGDKEIFLLMPTTGIEPDQEDRFYATISEPAFQENEYTTTREKILLYQPNVSPGEFYYREEEVIRNKHGIKLVPNIISADDLARIGQTERVLGQHIVTQERFADVMSVITSLSPVDEIIGIQNAGEIYTSVKDVNQVRRPLESVEISQKDASDAGDYLRHMVSDFFEDTPQTRSVLEGTHSTHDLSFRLPSKQIAVLHQYEDLTSGQFVLRVGVYEKGKTNEAIGPRICDYLTSSLTNFAIRYDYDTEDSKLAKQMGPDIDLNWAEMLENMTLEVQTGMHVGKVGMDEMIDLHELILNATPLSNGNV